MIKLNIIVLIYFEVIPDISATTHWVVTENGKIQSQLNSVFQLRQPHDLLMLLEQEKRLNDAQALYERIIARKASIDTQWTKIDFVSNVENLLYSTDEDCLAAGKVIGDIDLYASVATDGSFREGVMSKDFLLDGTFDKYENEVPDCKKTFPLDFSMYTFEHLSAMKNRKNLTQQAEKDLIKHLPPGMDIDKLSRHIAYGLLQNKTSWLHLNLAALYWRYKGDSYNALECARRAIITAPRKFRDIPLLTTGGIFHAAKQSAEAAVVLHTAIDYAPDQSRQHLALGHVYAALGDYKRSIACYDNCLKLSPNMDQARSAKHAILCHHKVENALLTLDRQLQDILSDLHTYDKEQEAWFKIQEHIMWDRDMRSPFFGLRHDFRSDISNLLFSSQSQSCIQKTGERSIHSCNIATESQMFAHNLQVDVSVSLQMLKNIEKQAKRINEQIAKSKFLHGFSDESHQIRNKNLEPLSIFMESTGHPMHNDINIVQSNNEFESETWPTELDCKSYKPYLIDTKRYVPVYLSPENKGYVVRTFLNELIGLGSGKEHSLPWNPPICRMSQNFHNSVISMNLLKAAMNVNETDSELVSALTSLAQGVGFPEIGQRILTATESKVVSPWALYMIASLYWRVMGSQRKALDCLQRALETVPNKFKDVPLVSVASIYHKVGLLNEALSITQQALDINSVEPTTNFLYGSLLHQKGNNSGAVHYLKQALRVDPHFMNDRALLMLRTITCQDKFSYDRIHDRTL